MRVSIVAGSGNGTPKFSMRNAIPISAEVRVPLVLGQGNQFGYLSLGGGAYEVLKGAPSQWSLYAALSFALDDIVKAVIPK